MLPRARLPTARVASAFLRPAVAAPNSRHASAIARREDQLKALKAALQDQLKVAELKGWTPEEVKQVLAVHASDIDRSTADLGLEADEIFHNASPGNLYEQALLCGDGSKIVSSGALAVKSGRRTGRSPLDKRLVFEAASKDDVWWGKVNVKMSPRVFLMNRERAVDYLNSRPRLYVVDGFGGWDEEFRVPVRVITSRAYHALFAQNILVPPAEKDLDIFNKGKPFVIFNAGPFPCNRQTDGMTSSTSVAISLERKEMVILGTQFAGEMKNGVITLMNYLMPLIPDRDAPAADRALSLLAAANIGPGNDVTLFFGLSGTGKTTLSYDPKRDLIGDDCQVWHSKGVFNIEGGCYAKTIGLTREKEPQIYNAIRFGAVQENVVFDPDTLDVDYDDASITPNTRVTYPLSFVPNARIPAKVPHQPKHIVLLTCDAFGVLPPLAKLTTDQVMYHFISGYTAKVEGTEDGVLEPQATFSVCFGAPFLVWHPYVYAEILAAKLNQTGATAYLVNTGWTGGPYGVGERCSLKHTRQLIDAIHDGTLASLSESEWDEMPIFGLKIPKCGIKDVPSHIIRPEESWLQAGKTADDYRKATENLAGLFQKNFEEYMESTVHLKFEHRPPDAVRAAGPKF